MIKKRNDAVDVFKWLCSWLVMYIHFAPVFTNAPMVDRLMSQGVCRIAVPFFFATSSFFLFAKMGDKKACSKQNREKVWKFCGHILLMYSAWIIIYSSYYAFYNQYNGLPQKNFSQYVLGFFFSGGLQQHLWYLIATVYAVPIVYLLWRSGRRTLIVAAVICEALCCLEWPYRFWPINQDVLRFLGKDITFITNAILNGVPLMCIGALCLQDHKRRSSKQWLIWTAVSATLYIAEIVGLYMYYGNKLASSGMITRGLLTYSLVNFLFTVRFQLPWSWMGKAFRLSSTWNYCAHMLVMMVLAWFFAFEGIKKYVIIGCLTVISGIPYIVIKLLLGKYKRNKKALNQV